uniref:SCAP-2 n=1 Tax=Charonia tritonis TaxID=1960912 RepID=A0A1S6JQ41_9CAEN|nr:sCAP-2 precursor [Charonia tritonis]
MDASACRMLLALLFVTATVTEAMNYLALPRMGRSGYIAFPRLGRGYLAFPRMGRSQGASVDAERGASCCALGLKTEWLLAEDGKTTTQNICEAKSCCQGLQEVMDQKPDGAFYTLCIPTCSSEETKPEAANENMLLKLKGLLRN